MKKYLLLSIKPKYIKEIELGLKKFEFRKVMPKFNSDISNDILLYCSKPEMKIIGKIELKEHYTTSFNDLMDIVNADDNYRDRISKYFQNKKKCNAIKINNYLRYEKSVHLKDLRILEPGFVPGQNYRYLSVKSKIIEEIILRNGKI